MTWQLSFQLVIIVTMFTLVGIARFGIIRNTKARARRVHKALHGEAVNFTQYRGESSVFLLELIHLEQERERLKLEKLTAEQTEAVNKFLRAQAWLKMVRSYTPDAQLLGIGKSPIELVEEPANALHAAGRIPIVVREIPK